jgi:hypothetical protein
MENKHIVICGDSFNIGIGCRDLDNEPYGQLLAKELNKPIINLAKGSSTNFSIYLQAKYAVENLLDKVDLVIISPTSYNRIDWFPVSYKFPHGEITNTDVNYHQYPPYGPHTYHVDNQMIQIDHPMKDDPNYKGSMFTENLMGVVDYWETFRSKDKESGYYARFKNEPKERTKTLYDYGISIHEERINRIQSIGVITLAHELLKRSNINHLILTHEPVYYKKFIDEINVCELDWGRLSMIYPDDLPSKHTSKEGHKVAFEKVLDKLKINGWMV